MLSKRWVRRGAVEVVVAVVVVSERFLSLTPGAAEVEVVVEERGGGAGVEDVEMPLESLEALEPPPPDAVELDLWDASERSMEDPLL